jgi:ribosomal protein S26
MSDDRAVKKVFLGKSDGRRKAGRPKLRWIDCILNLKRVPREGGSKQKTDLLGLSF